MRCLVASESPETCTSKCIKYVNQLTDAKWFLFPLPSSQLATTVVAVSTTAAMTDAAVMVHCVQTCHRWTSIHQSAPTACMYIVCLTYAPTLHVQRAQHSRARRSMAQHSAAQHSTAQHSTAQHSTAQHSTAQHSTAQHSTAQHSAAQHSTLHYIKLDYITLLT